LTFILEISPRPSFLKEGLKSSLWKREVRRDFIKKEDNDV